MPNAKRFRPTAFPSLSQIATRFTEWSERYIPDAFIFALLATILIFGLSLGLTPSGPERVLGAWGRGFWELLPFTMQMSLIIITGYVLATAAPIHRLIVRLAALPDSPRAAVLLVALFSMITSWFNWGFSLIISAILAREVAKRNKLVDYRALAAASFLGQGSMWAQGISGSANLQMCTPESLQPAIRAVVSRGGLVPGGIIGLQDTAFLWQTLLTVLVEIALVGVVVWFYTPLGNKAKTAAKLNIDLEDRPAAPVATRARTPGEWLEHSPILNWVIGGLGLGYLGMTMSNAPDSISAVTLNNINFFFLMVGVLAHGKPHHLMNAFRNATPSVWGAILQFPFYAGIAGMITGTDLNTKIAGFFVSISNQVTFAPIISIYSTILGVFVPSGGSKWIIEAPYVLAAAHDLKVHLGWVVSVYNLGEALANLIQPFWMVPVLTILGLKARDVMGYTTIVFLALLPVVLIMVTVLGMTLRYPL
ncbi:MAG: TIGR00366 family protein [Oligoflexia bacterium]|nr:TIGR00366 family protein [Oligoflexia bacterium]